MVFGFGSSSSNRNVDAANIAAVETEIDLVRILFDGLAKTCYEKCVPPKYTEAELNKGEAVCVDRCVSKYLDVNTKIGAAAYANSAETANGRQQFRDVDRLGKNRTEIVFHFK